MPNKNEVISFYDGFVPNLSQENLRHLKVYKSLDLLPKGKALDIGCGAGLTSKRLADGDRDVLAIDFSPMAIAYAKMHNGHERIDYQCIDIEDFKTDMKFDSVCLVDVLEHLDQIALSTVWNLIRSASKSETIVYLNIPYSETISYLKKNRPGILQPIDEAISIGSILNAFKEIGFVMFKMDFYWMQYVEMFFMSMEKFENCIGRIYKIGV